MKNPGCSNNRGSFSVSPGMHPTKSRDSKRRWTMIAEDSHRGAYDRQLGSLQLLLGVKQGLTSSFPHIFFPARLGFLL